MEHKRRRGNQGRGGWEKRHILPVPSPVRPEIPASSGRTGEAYLVAGSYPDESMYLLQHLFNNWFTKMDFDKMAAAAVCMGLLLFAAIMLLQKLWDEGD